MSEAKKGAERLLGCYRVGDAHDPETYIAAVVAVLMRYPVDVIRAVTEPATGVASKLKWLPSIAEIREECQSHMPSWSVQWAMEWERNAQKMIEERKPLAITDGRPRKTYEQLQAELAECGIFIGKQPQHAVDVGAFRAQHGISLEQWDAIPNAPKRA